MYVGVWVATTEDAATTSAVEALPKSGPAKIFWAGLVLLSLVP
jgi:hypothetical protein